MPRETMTSRERWHAVLTRRTPDRVPMDYWGTKEATDKLTAHLGCADFDEVAALLHIDKPLTVGGRYVGPPHKPGENVWGVRHRDVNYGSGVYTESVSSPLAKYSSVAEIEANYRFPSPDWWDFKHLPELVRGQEHRPIRGGGSEPFILYKELRGEEQAFMDLIENPEIVDFILDRLFGLAYEHTRRIFEAIPGQVMITYVAEDLGGQTSLIYSPAQIKRFLLPRMKRMMDLTRENGSFVFTHTDGAVRQVIPDLIATGTQVLNPIQWVCPGMEREGLKRDFGDKLIFHGGVDNQRTLPFGTVEDVRKEVAEDLGILGKGGGYILAPCHNIQVITPAENIVAMYEEGWRLGFEMK
jgi:uroporphyrinogen decarboxylase